MGATFLDDEDYQAQEPGSGHLGDEDDASGFKEPLGPGPDGERPSK